jgi:hypothetical protein
VFLDADRHELMDGMIRFYRGDVVHAEYAGASVLELAEDPAFTPRTFVPLAPPDV